MSESVEGGKFRAKFVEWIHGGSEICNLFGKVPIDNELAFQPVAISGRHDAAGKPAFEYQALHVYIPEL